MDHFHIVEIGCGLGGPAGDIAKRLLCIVPGIDMTEPFVEAAHRLTGLLHMEEEVKVQHGEGQRLPYHPMRVVCRRPRRACTSVGWASPVSARVGHTSRPPRGLADTADE
jgi:hypothetical protein